MKKRRMGVNLYLPVLGIIASFFFIATGVKSEPVAVSAVEQGQGFTFTHAGNCYVVFPRHVAEGQKHVQVIAEGALSSRASVRFPFWEGMDLAVGIFAPGKTKGCSAASDVFLHDEPIELAQGDGELVLVDRQGFVRRHLMRIDETTYHGFEATFLDATQVQQGMSGAFLMRGETLLGMALETKVTKRVAFLSMQEIAYNLSRWLVSQEANLNLAEGQDEASSPAGDSSRSTLQLQLLEASPPAIDVDHMAENVLIEGSAYIFKPRGPATITLGVKDTTTERAIIHRVTIRSKEGAESAIPRRILISVSRDSEGESWTHFWIGEMAANGVLDTGKRAPAFAQRIKITIATAWREGLVRVDSIVAQ